MRVGIIGGGFGLTIQAPIIKTHPNLNLTTVCTMKRHHLPEELLNGEDSPVHYKDWSYMLENEEIDLLFVSSIPTYHFEMVKYALNKGINVVCEKPFTMNSKESKELDLRKYNTEIIIAGSGFNGNNRDNKVEENNKRFIIQIIPKIMRPEIKDSIK